ncbi:MAG: hypothetical protein ABIC95_00880 [archaeon]
MTPKNDSTKQSHKQEEKEWFLYVKNAQKYGAPKGLDAKNSDDDGQEEATEDETLLKPPTACLNEEWAKHYEDVPSEHKHDTSTPNASPTTSS